jgi:hypothetical protein
MNGIVADQEALWAAMNGFFGAFAPEDWSRQHGKDWTFADVPYHLAYFNRLLADAVTRGDATSEEDALSTLAELDAWNKAQFARRPAGQTAQQSFEEMRASQSVLRSAVSGSALDRAVWLPILRGRGWRTTHFALEYNFWHTWLHYCEAHLRFNDQIDGISAALMQRGIDFNMQLIAGAVNPSRAGRFVWVLELTDSGVWSFVIERGAIRVERQAASNADVVMTTHTAMYLKTSAFNIQSPLLALLRGGIRVRGLNKLSVLQRLFSPSPQQVWQPMEQGAVKH